MKKTEREHADFGTPELAKRLTVVPKLTGGGFSYQGKVMDENEIDRLLLNDRITSAEHSILGAFMAKLVKANFVGVRSPSYDSAMHADPATVGDRRANIVRSVVALFKRLDGDMGRGKRVALTNLVLTDAPWPASDDDLKEAIRLLSRVLADPGRE